MELEFNSTCHIYVLAKTYDLIEMYNSNKRKHCRNLRGCVVKSHEMFLYAKQFLHTKHHKESLFPEDSGDEEKRVTHPYSYYISWLSHGPCFQRPANRRESVLRGLRESLVVSDEAGTTSNMEAQGKRNGVWVEQACSVAREGSQIYGFC